jgi:predicted LPLAT superfamily acyltransferase
LRVTAPPTSPPADQAWTGRTRGGTLLFQVCAALLPWVGALGAYVISFGIAFGFLAGGGRRQYGMLEYWRRLRPRASTSLLVLCLWRHFASFGRILCDRLLVFLRPGRYRFEYVNGEPLRAAIRERRGCILLSAHVGNWELSGFWLKHVLAEDHPVFLVMVRDDLPRVQSYVDVRMRGRHITVIDPHDGLAASLAIARALGDGHPVCMLGDRVFGGQDFMEAGFLGGQARFPLGPFQSALITGVPIYVTFLVKTGLRSYRLEVDPPWHLGHPPRGPRRQAALVRAVSRWGRRLELQVRRYPFQWHNFFPFWGERPHRDQEGRGRSHGSVPELPTPVAVSAT